MTMTELIATKYIMVHSFGLDVMIPVEMFKETKLVRHSNASYFVTGPSEASMCIVGAVNRERGIDNRWPLTGDVGTDYKLNQLIKDWDKGYLNSRDKVLEALKDI